MPSLRTALAAAALAAASAAQAFTPFGPPTTFNRPGASSTQLWDVNDAGALVGSSDGIGFLYSGGVFTDIVVPGASLETLVTGLTADAQTLVGLYTVDAGGGTVQQRGFVYSGGSFSDFVVPGAVDTSVRHISDNGRYLTGLWTDIDGTTHGYAYDRSTSTRTDFLAAPGGIAIAQGANDAGLVVGSFIRLPSVPGPTISGGFVHDLASGTHTEVFSVDGRNRPRFRDINNAGLISGHVGNDSLVGDGTQWQFFLSPGADISSSAYGLNNTGTVVGYRFDSVSERYEGWIATTVPEPSTWALWGLGLAALTTGARRARGRTTA